MAGRSCGAPRVPRDAAVRWLTDRACGVAPARFTLRHTPERDIVASAGSWSVHVPYGVPWGSGRRAARYRRPARPLRPARAGSSPLTPFALFVLFTVGAAAAVYVACVMHPQDDAQGGAGRR